MTERGSAVRGNCLPRSNQHDTKRNAARLSEGTVCRASATGYGPVPGGLKRSLLTSGPHIRLAGVSFIEVAKHVRPVEAQRTYMDAL